MEMLCADDIRIEAESRPKSVSLARGSVAAWRYSTFIEWSVWTLAVILSLIVSINILFDSIIIIIIFALGSKNPKG